MTKKRIPVGTKVKVKRCTGVALVTSYIPKYEVYLLDRQMSVRFDGRDQEEGVVVSYVKYWTFPESELEVQNV